MSETARLSHSFRKGKIVLYKRAWSSFWQAQLKYAPSKYKRISTKIDDLDDALEVAEDKLYDLNYTITYTEYRQGLACTLIDPAGRYL